MKKKLLSTFGFILGALYVSAQSFVPGNLAVYRYGNGTAAMANSQTVPVFIDEYTPAGVLVKTRAIPVADNAGNFKLTGLGKNATGNYVDEGISTLSQDGKYLTIFGYNQSVGGAVPTTGNGLVVGVIAADGSYNSTTTLSNNATTGLGSPRSAVIDGTNIWANGSQNGIQYTTLGATSSTRVSTGQETSKSLTIGRTWASNALQPSRLYIASATASKELPYATPLPTTSTTFTTSVNFTTDINANQVAIVTVSNRTLIYVADDASNSIRRYFLNYGGTGLGAYPGELSDASTSNIKSLTTKTRVVGPNTLVDVYATTWGHDGTGTETSKLITFTDSYLTTNATNDLPNTILASTTTTLATAPANTLFKSVTFVPEGSTAVGTGTLPVNLVNFGAKKAGDYIELNWTTLSEQNNSYFDVLRSGNGSDFVSIGRVSGNGNSNTKINYSFTDKAPQFGANYYQLNQVDFDGKASNSKTVAVNYGFAENLKMSVSQSADNSGLNVVVNSPASSAAKISVVTITGQQSAVVDVVLEKGKTAVNIPVNLQPGIYVVTLFSKDGKTSQKVSIR